jgi:predicted DNA-binding protein
MAKMNQRTTFSLDEITLKRIKTLAARWSVSQAEVVRRAIELTVQQDAGVSESLITALSAVQAETSMVEKDAATYLNLLCQEAKR